MDCGSKGCRFKSFFLPLSIYRIFYFYNNFFFILTKLKLKFLNNFLSKTYFIFNYYLLNELILQEGLFIDFLQKKIIDNWIKKFLIISSYLFNERVLFDKVVRFYLDLIIWPMHKLSIFEFNNVSNTLFVIIFLFLLFFFIFIFLYSYFLMF